MGKDLESEVWTAISAFEQILEAMPNDRASLDALSHAYQQIGDHTKAREYLFRYGTILVEEADVKAASELLDKLEKYADQDTRIQELIKTIQGMAEAEKRPEAASTAAEKKGAAAAQAKVKAADIRNSGFNMHEEMSFAWNLSEAQQITQEEYASVIQDLTDLSASAVNSTVSVLHVLENRSFKNLEKIISYVSKECNTPIISLAFFELKPEPIALLPLDFMIRRGVLAFEQLGKEALVVIMNPYDKQLQKDVESATARKCHFFVSLPSEFDKALIKAREVLVPPEDRK